MGNRYIECGLHGAIGYRGYGVKGYGHMGQQSTGVWGTGHMDDGYRGMGHTRSCVPLDPTFTPSQ